MGRSSRDIQAIAAPAIVDRVLARRQAVLHRPLEQANLSIVFSPQGMAQTVTQHQGPTGSDGIDEERVRSIERVDEAPLGDCRPTVGLHGAREFERQFIKRLLPRIERDSSLLHQA